MIDGTDPKGANQLRSEHHFSIDRLTDQFAIVNFSAAAQPA
jgi:hypothetical protein